MTDSVKKKIWGDKAAAIEAGLTALDPDLAELITEVAYERVLAREGLELKIRELLSIAYLTALGSESELKTHVYGALNCGASFTEIKETVLQAALFVGFPRAVAAMKVVRAVEERQKT